MMRFDSETFGPYLRHERERRGISLDAISARTKIARAMLAKLERGDLDGWPAGIFRRSFFREYVNAIGLDADPLLEEFQRLFPDPAAAAQPFGDRPVERPAPAGELRLTLDAAPPPTVVPIARVRVAAFDTLSIVAAAALVAAIVGHAAIATAAIAILYHALATVWADRTPGALLARRTRAAAASNAGEALLTRAPRLESRRAERARRPRGHRRVVDAGGIHGTRVVS